MSSILKALKRVEDDKASRRPDELKIDAEILRTANPPRFPTAGVTLVSLLLMASASTATYMYMRKDKALELKGPKYTAISAQNRLPSSGETDIKNERLPAAVEVVPAEPQNAMNEKRSMEQQAAAPTKSAPSMAVAKTSKPVAVLIPATPTRKIESTSPPPLAVEGKDIPTLRVNGIAFQNSNADSMAIVNGIPVSSGQKIEGVTIEEVRKDRVVFQKNEDRFEILLGQANR